MGHAELEPEDIDETITPLRGALKRTYLQFCTTTSIHGLRYTRSNCDTHRFVRFIWLLILLTMLGCAAAMVLSFYDDYTSSPTRLNVENDHAPISNLLFPGLSVCPEVLFDEARASKYISTLKLPSLLTARDVTDRLMLNQGFMRNDDNYSKRDLEIMQQVLQLNNLTVVDFLQQLRWNCDDLLFRCRYQFRMVNCNEFFQVSRTYFGYCCSFNLNQTGLNFTAQYMNAGLSEGLSFILYYNNTGYEQRKSYSQGFRIVISDINGFPSVHGINKFVPLNEEVFIALRTTETFCSQAIKQLPIESRMCYLAYEYPMAHVNPLVASNCDLNCRAIKMVRFCGCIPYYFDREQYGPRVCTYTDIPCLTDNFAEILGRFRNTQCTCPNLCERVEYNADLSLANLQLDAPTIDEFYDGIEDNFAVVHIYMNSEIYRRVRRDLLTNTVLLVSNLGSAFSLFLGMSMVSLVEILYYLIVVLQKYYKQELRARQKLLTNKQAKIEETKKTDGDGKKQLKW